MHGFPADPEYGANMRAVFMKPEMTWQQGKVS